MGRNILLVNDVHIGVQRSGGTTPASAMALREWLFNSFHTLLVQHPDQHLLLNGDLFDQFNVPLSDVWETYQILAGWLSGSDSECKLILGRGNHDIAKNSALVSSFDFLARLLVSQFGARVVVVTDGGQMVLPGIYMIPHMPNQDIFDVELSRVPDDANLVLLHANYDNHFAVESDHSLNVSEEQARIITTRGNNPDLIFGHEHQARTELKGKVIITGNQWPTSIADCMRNPDNMKYAHIISASGTGDLAGISPTGDFDLTQVPTWDGNNGSFHEMPWDEIEIDHDAQFIRVVGEATSEQAKDVIAAVAEVRKRSDAFVVTNAVKVAGMSDMDELKLSMEEVKSFDVLNYLLEQLDDRQAAVVKNLLEQNQLKEAA